MRVVVPFGARDPKTRLNPFFTPDERREFARAMLRDVLDALSAYDTEVVATAPVEVAPPVTVDTRPLTEAVNAVLAATTPVAVVMADLPLLTADTVVRLFEPDTDLVFAPGVGGGTNAIVVRHPEFRADYHGASIRDHRTRARELGASVTELDSFRAATDIDEPGDLAELLLHGDGAAADWLNENGVELETGNGRVSVCRR